MIDGSDLAHGQSVVHKASGDGVANCRRIRSLSAGMGVGVGRTAWVHLCQCSGSVSLPDHHAGSQPQDDGRRGLGHGAGGRRGNADRIKGRGQENPTGCIAETYKI